MAGVEGLGGEVGICHSTMYSIPVALVWRSQCPLVFQTGLAWEWQSSFHSPRCNGA